MHHYPNHIGDYDSATAHLTMVEDGAYGRLLRLYYRKERALPVDISECCRLVRAASKPERDAVMRCIKEFFELRDDGWHNKRADEEIEAYRNRINQSRDAAAKRWHSARNATASNRHSVRNANQNQEPEPITGNQSDGVEVGGISKAVERPVEKDLHSTPTAPITRGAIQNPAWLFSFDHAKLHARKLGIHIAGKTHQELKDAIAARSGLEPEQERRPKFA